MDDTNGLMTIPCQHVFHCACLQGWSGSGCPVCRYTGPSPNDASSTGNPGGAGGKHAFGSSVSNLCAACDCPEDLWICLICGRVGCGRYKGGHAKEHWKDTAHSFALEIETQHVWDYAGDTWVHRLIRAKGDGKVVELPSRNNPGDPLGEGGGGGGSGEDDMIPKAKVEAMGLEYTHLLTSQLESQRVYFEEKVAQAADKAHTASQAAESAASRAGAAVEKLRAVEDRYEELRAEVVPQLERDAAREKRRADKATELARRLGQELQEERGMGKGLAERVAHLEKEAEASKGKLKELEALREENADLAMFISGQKTLREMESSGRLEAGELEGSSASAPAGQSGGGGGRRRRKK
jgi:BRCA1-associated protein